MDKILAAKREEVAFRKEGMPLPELTAGPLFRRPTLSLRRALEAVPCGVIAEFKRRSPSRGFIKEGADAAGIVGGYAAAGAAACSVLTDSAYFGGSLDDLVRARASVGIPLLRKDFVIDPYQIAEARAHGADAVLLIAAALSPGQCSELAAYAHTLGLEVLMEVHAAAELGHLNPCVDLVGVNNRNLATFVTDVDTSFKLADRIPARCVKVSESGIYSAGTVKALQKAGYRGFLIGDSFMREPDPALALKKLLEDAR